MIVASGKDNKVGRDTLFRDMQKERHLQAEEKGDWAALLARIFLT